MSLRGVWLYYPGGHMRLSTALMALAILLWVTWRTRRPYVAGVAVMAWISLFEMAWQACTTLAHGGTWASEGWYVAAVISWVLLAHALGVRPDWRLLLVSAAALLAWLAFGFDSNYAGRPPYNIRDEVLNEVSKTALGLAYLLGALRVPRSENPLRLFSRAA
jgi:hypothetical protein